MCRMQRRRTTLPVTGSKKQYHGSAEETHGATRQVSRRRSTAVRTRRAKCRRGHRVPESCHAQIWSRAEEMGFGLMTGTNIGAVRPDRTDWDWKRRAADTRL